MPIQYDLFESLKIRLDEIEDILAALEQWFIENEVQVMGEEDDPN